MVATTAAERREWLIESLVSADSALADWLDALAEFDSGQEWAADGQLSCVDWLMWRGRVSRSTAYERVQVARQLRCRPILRHAFRSGRVSYSVVRLMARMVDPAQEVEEAVIAAAEAGTVRDVERLVGAYQRHQAQHRKPADTVARRGVRVRPNYDGTSTVEITLEDLEVADFMSGIDALVEWGDSEPEQGSEAGTQSARADCGGQEGAGRPTWHQRRADAVMDMVRTAMKHVGGGQASGDDRFLVHVVAFAEGMTLLDGTALDAGAAARLACDSSATQILLGPEWEPLAMGRRRRTWTAAQRRATLIRDGGRCRFPGCQSRRYLHVHHHDWWTRGGPTDVANAYTACSAHHGLIHSGWTVTGDANRELTFHRPDGTVLGESRPWPGGKPGAAGCRP